MGWTTQNILRSHLPEGEGGGRERSALVPGGEGVGKEGGGQGPSFAFPFDTQKGEYKLNYNLPPSASPVFLPRPAPFPQSFVNPSSQSTVQYPWDCNRSGQSSDEGLGAGHTALCHQDWVLHQRLCSIPRSPPASLHPHTCTHTHTALLLKSSEPLHGSEWSFTHLWRHRIKAM